MPVWGGAAGSAGSGRAEQSGAGSGHGNRENTRTCYAPVIQSHHNWQQLPSRTATEDKMSRQLVAGAGAVRRLGEFEKHVDEPEVVTIEVPEHVEQLSDEELADLRSKAVAAFDEVYGDGSAVSDEDLDALKTLTTVLETLTDESDKRATANTARADEAKALAGKVRPEADDDPEPDPEPETEPDEDETVETKVKEVPEMVSADGSIKLSMKRKRPAPRAIPKMRERVLASDAPGHRSGEGMDWDDIGSAINQQLTSFNASQYVTANRQGRHMREQNNIAVMQRTFPKAQIIDTTDSTAVNLALTAAANEKVLPGGSLVASGGWCAPSEQLYDILETESLDGLVSTPEVQVNRGGISFMKGPDFATLYAMGWQFSEANDIGGTYAVDGNGVGTGGAGDKPCVAVDCPDPEEVRLGVVGLCITAGLLQQRGYPEVIARTVRGAMVAHRHRVSANTLSQIAAGSTAITMTTAQVGATAPILDAIEKQVEHMKYVGRLSRGTSVEGIFPYWVRGVIRSDLARRNGGIWFDITDAQIDGWFRNAGINPQYVYDYKPLTGTAANMKTWPANAEFILYPAGTWVRGTTSVINLSTLYDSDQLGQNNYTALFFEEGQLVAMRGTDSRAIKVAVCASGETAAAIEMECDGTATAPASV